MHQIKIIIYFCCFFILIPVINLAEVHSLYRIENPDRDIINYLEREGGLVERYFPGAFAEVYLTDDLKEMLIEKDYILRPAEARQLNKITSDSLSDDHIIGSSYHSYAAVSFILDSLVNLHSHITRLYSLGQTVLGREMWAVCITDNPDREEIEPKVKFIANMHGNEVITQEMMLFLIDTLVNSYGLDQRITNLIDSTEIWIVPNMNFDGLEMGTRMNANGIDLNRSFPDREYDLFSDPAGREPETRHIMAWSDAHNFVLAANFHSGALVANYPWDKNLPGSAGYAATPDDDTFIRLALSYSRNNPAMYASTYFEQGITNGVMWYEVPGSMQDWNYHWLDCMEITIEISENKIPPAEQLSDFWNDNRKAMLTYLEQVHTGLRGVITDSKSGDAIPAEVRVAGNEKIIQADGEFGDYYRLLESGSYDVEFWAEGYYPTIFENVIIDSGKAATLNVSLDAIPRYAFSGTVIDSFSLDGVNGAVINFYQDALLIDSVRADAIGSFAISLYEGDYQLKIRAEGYLSKTDSLQLYSDQARGFALVRLEQTWVYGTVSLQDGTSPQGAVVYCRDRTDTLSDSGRYSFENIRPAEINIFAYKTNYRTAHRQATVKNGDSLQVNFNLSPGFNDILYDFEHDSAMFTGNQDWQHGIPHDGPGHAFSGEKVWGTMLDENYKSGAHTAVLETPFMFIQGMIVPRIEIYHWYELEEGYDGGNVKISTDEGQSWQVLHPSPDYLLTALPDDYGNPLAGQPAFTGRSFEWSAATFDLSAFKDTPFIKLRFELGVDEQKEAPGWYIDNFKLFDANATVFSSMLPENLQNKPQVKLFPNPANPASRIFFKSDQAGEIKLDIFNIRGQRILSESLPAQPGQWQRFDWQGNNNHNLPVASGVYLVRVEIGGKSITKKLVLIR